ncbi:hypothetical protein RRG08_056629 [Elysia crispata]|uniref:Uncharacterized protein n=1 Tax=Elysia crispata TaxID=231223 RepID=A0AAE0Z3R4_9GAST|nr:hypothetical protein RRG08_056629 [Elysia crispata]
MSFVVQASQGTQSWISLSGRNRPPAGETMDSGLNGQNTRILTRHKPEIDGALHQQQSHLNIALYHGEGKTWSQADNTILTGERREGEGGTEERR